MFEEVRIRERKSVKYGKTYEYRFETAPVGGERKWLSKGGFMTEEEAKEAGIEAWKRYCLCGLSERPSDISYADFLDEWMEKECKFNLKETTLLNYRKRIRIHIKPELGTYQVRRLNRERLQKFLQDKYNDGYSKNTLSTLGYEGISTHSFRKWYATEIYKANGFDIALVQRLLQHSSAATTQRYIGIEPQRIEQAIQNHAQLL